MKTSLVTGAAGFIGLNLVEELVRRNYIVYALVSNQDSEGTVRLKAISSSVNVLSNIRQLTEKADEYPRFDSVFHLASVGVRPGFEDIDLICDVNIKMGCRIVDIAKKNRAKVVINFGSCFEYGNHNGEILLEDMNCEPESLYAISKNASTNLTMSYAKLREAELITVRPFGVYGKGEAIGRLAPSIITSCMKGDEVKTTPGNQVRDFVNVRDVVCAVIELSEADYTPYEIYNICSNSPVRVKDFILEIIKVCGFDSNLIKFGALPYRSNEAMFFAGNNDKLQKIIQYNFPRNHKEGITELYNSLKV